MSQDQGGRDEALLEEALRAVEVGRHGVEQPRALPQAADQRLPLGRGQDHGQHVEPPRLRRSLGSGVHVVGDAVLVDLPGHHAFGPRELLRVHRARVGRELLVVAAQPASSLEDLVVVAVRRHVIVEESRKIGRPGGREIVHDARRSSVWGNSRLRSAGLTTMRPGVCPIRTKRDSRRASASKLLIGKRS